MGVSVNLFCRNCGELILDAAVCPACGTPKPAPADIAGGLIWRAELGRPLPRPRCYAVLAGDRLCIPTEAGGVIAVELTAGDVVWEHTLPEASATYTLASDGARVFVGPYDTRSVPRRGRTLLALDAATGAVVWSFAHATHSYSGAAVLGDTVFVTTADGAIHALDGASGAVRWSQPHPDWGPAAPAIANGLLVAGGRGELLVAYDPADGRERWRFRGGGWFATRVAIVDDVVAAHCWDGYLYGLDAESGALRWKLRGERGQGFSSPPAPGPGMFLIGDRVRQNGGAGYALRALQASDGAELWRRPTSRYVSALPAVEDGLILCPTEADELLALDAADGAVRWRVELSADATTRPLFAGDLAYVADHDGAIYALRAWARRASPATAEELLAAGDVEGAAAAYALRGELGAAAELYDKQLDSPAAAARLYEREGEFVGAAAAWERAGELQRAREAYRAAGDALALAGHLARTGEPLEAARLYEELGRPGDAAALYEQAGDKTRAAELYKEAGRAEEARRATDSQHVWELQVDHLLAKGDHAGAAALLVLHGQLELAADRYEQAGRLADALLIRIELKHWERAADLALQLGDLEHAAEAFEQMGQKGRAAEIYERAAAQALDVPGADARLAAGLYERAASLYAEVFDERRAATCEREVRRHRQLPELTVTLLGELEFVEQEWNTVTLELRNVGFGPARSIQVRPPARFELGNAPLLAGVPAGREVRLIISLRPQPNELGQRVPLSLRVAYRDAQETEYEAEAQTFARVAPKGLGAGHITPTPAALSYTPARQSEQSEVPLTLRFAIDSEGVEITWEAHSIGMRVSRFVPPYTGADLDLVVRALDELQLLTGSLSPGELDRLAALGLPVVDGRLTEAGHRAVGRALLRALTADPRGAEALSIVWNYARATGQPLALRLRFPPDAIELAALPWELLWDHGPAPLLLSHGQMAGCTRHLELAEALPPPRPRRGPLRILAITPHAGVDAEARERERAERTAAWTDLIVNGEVVMEELSPATRRALSERMLSGPPPDIVHFVGHGRYADGEGWLVIDRAGGGWDRVPASRLMPLFSEVRLVVLCACQGAMSGDGGLLTGVAPALSAAGVPAVVAMQLTVRAVAATRFSEVMYRALARGESLQRAVVQARQALYVEETDAASWYVPTLTIRARDPGPFFLFGG